MIYLRGKLNNPPMGTETRSISSNTFHSGLFSVKLNNPLMGTEIRGTYDNQCPKRSLVTKLNDPHKGTEQTNIFF